MAMQLVIGALDRGPTDKAETLVLLALADGADGETGETWPSLARIALRSRLTRRGVQKVLARLEADGWLSIDRHRTRPNGSTTSNIYRLNVARLDPEGVERRAARSAKTEGEPSSPPPEARSRGRVNTVHRGGERRSPYGGEPGAPPETTQLKQSARDAAPACELAAQIASDTARRQPERARSSEATASREAARDVGELDAWQRTQVREGKAVLIGGALVQPGSPEHHDWQAALHNAERCAA